MPVQTLFSTRSCAPSRVLMPSLLSSKTLLKMWPCPKRNEGVRELRSTQRLSANVTWIATSCAPLLSEWPTSEAFQWSCRYEFVTVMPVQPCVMSRRPS